MSWHLGRMCPFDLETTGPAPETARIAQVYVGLVGGGQDPLDLCDLLVNPGIPMPDETAKIHGLTTEYLTEHGHPAAEAIGAIANDVAEALLRGIPVVGHNVRYDLTVLDRECRRYGLPTVDDLTGGALGPVIDTQILSKHVDKYRRRVSKEQGAQVLKTCAAAFDIPWDDDAAHGARADALIAARVAWRIGQYAAMPRADRPAAKGRRLEAFDVLQVDLPTLHATQKRLAVEQDRDLAAYFRGEAERSRDADEQIEFHTKAASCTGHWPLIPHTDTPTPLL
ncbi:exonuclease domain-containing protein [Actinomadura harenae]|uniref:DNA polymerase III subunit epsilon n=1 Tax=Actinomadura harenae TaxID=2483351 RepID=A0A3M2MDN5_9ACTN|nr:exonuclease domain-containing protein [Actinomadura harenae]RMI47576.1 DNA polymerase III subunit epsilon [Actinomadura harenae]